MTSVNKNARVGWTMRYVFGNPKAPLVKDLMGIHTQDDLISYIRRHNIQPPSAPRAQAVQMMNLAGRFNEMPEQFSRVLMKYLLKLGHTADRVTLNEAVKSVIWTIDIDYKYYDVDYGRNYANAIKMIAQLLEENADDEMKRDINDAMNEALEEMENAIDESNYMI